MTSMRNIVLVFAAQAPAASPQRWQEHVGEAQLAERVARFERIDAKMFPAGREGLKGNLDCAAVSQTARLRRPNSCSCRGANEHPRDAVPARRLLWEGPPDDGRVWGDRSDDGPLPPDAWWRLFCSTWPWVVLIPAIQCISESVEDWTVAQEEKREERREREKLDKFNRTVRSPVQDLAKASSYLSFVAKRAFPEWAPMLNITWQLEIPQFLAESSTTTSSPRPWYRGLFRSIPTTTTSTTTSPVRLPFGLGFEVWSRLRPSENSRSLAQLFSGITSAVPSIILIGLCAGSGAAITILRFRCSNPIVFEEPLMAA
eukprot:gnl/TRDRNA2_/TRDRNA2_138248_c0_seq1.p1 gnl/TRDRNA2_/TRDRNA2_138248_c0~~gnl/TRDRNA2_/TRDRNA2_138248_c0_seq1.p1  ORF type:complete len:315 (-),score=30.38 gnl/TRDRNA2_/TRDRNA2_138248_c0_seq1:88-1032(-)